MIKKGNLYRYSETGSNDPLVEVVRTWDKRDIDFDNPLSVAIVGMVTFTYLSGPNIGKTRSVLRRTFSAVAQLQDQEKV
tara:strand:- start:419 stop:655 length:237 start_codon:yes stop_codon:yes gene_type:complete